MSTYYEILNVPTTASAAEIQTAYEQQYNKWRRLVTHHDPNVVNQANQALQALETIRVTLTDPSKRSVYDAGISLSGASELADPDAVLGMSPPHSTVPPSPKPSSLPTAGSPGLWVCPKCGTDNPEHTQYCYKCTTQLVRTCPKCGNMSSLISTGICGMCGTQYETFVERIQLEKQWTGLSNRRATLEQHINSLTQSAKASNPAYGNLVLAFVLGIIGIMIGCLQGTVSLFANSANSVGLACGWIIPFGGGGIALVALGLWTYRHNETKRVNLVQKLMADIEFEQRQVNQLETQCDELSRAIQNLG